MNKISSTRLETALPKVKEEPKNGGLYSQIIKSRFAIENHQREASNFPSCIQMLESYECNICGFSTHLLLDLYKHTQIIHKVDCNPKIERPHRRYKCKNCNFKTFSLLFWLRHFDRGCPINECTECSFTTLHRPNLRRHKARMHTASSHMKWFPCDHCPYKSKSNHVLEAHILTKHTAPEQIQWFECQLCPYKGKHKDYLRKHMVSMHQNKWFECDQCPYKASSKYCLKAHKRDEHTLEKKFQMQFLLVFGQVESALEATHSGETRGPRGNPLV
jgi:hypothetical protein